MGRVYFISIVLLLSFAMNFYVLARLCGLFGIKKGLVFWTVVIICTVSLIGASIFRSSVGNVVGRIVYTIAAGWYGVLWLSLSTLIVYEVVRPFIKIKSSVAGTSIIIVVALVTICSIINAQLIHIKSLEIPGPADIDIVQLSDIHVGSVGVNFLKRVIDKTNALNPDLVLITGDLVDNFDSTAQKAIELLKNLRAPVFFVTGNHERYAGADAVTKSLTAANVRVLNNQLVDYGHIQILGIAHNDSEKHLERIIEELNIDDSGFCILMCHRPVELETLSKTGIDLALTGHTHAGQIFPFNYVVGLFCPYVSGLHNHNNTYIYVTSGTGTWGPRMRFGSRSEIVRVKIRKKL